MLAGARSGGGVAAFLVAIAVATAVFATVAAIFGRWRGCLRWRCTGHGGNRLSETRDGLEIGGNTEARHQRRGLGALLVSDDLPSDRLELPLEGGGRRITHSLAHHPLAALVHGLFELGDWNRLVEVEIAIAGRPLQEGAETGIHLGRIDQAVLVEVHPPDEFGSSTAARTAAVEAPATTETATVKAAPAPKATFAHPTRSKPAAKPPSPSRSKPPRPPKPPRSKPPFETFASARPAVIIVVVIVVAAATAALSVGNRGQEQDANDRAEKLWAKIHRHKPCGVGRQVHHLHTY